MHTDIDIEVLLVGLQRILSENIDSPLSDICKKFKNFKPEDWSKKNVGILIQDLSTALLQPTCTLEIATRFPQLVIPFLSISIDSSKHKGISHRRKCVALGKLVTLHPDALRCAVKFFENNGPPWEDPSDVGEMSTPRKKLKNDDDVADFEIALTCLNFLQASASHFRNIWKWSSFIKKFIDHECFKVRWAVCRCITVVICMDETQYYSMINNTVTREELELCLLEVSHSTNYNNLITNATDETAGDSAVKIVASKKGITQLFHSVVTISGITLPVFDKTKQTAEDSLVLVQSTISNLRSAALGVACGKAVCLMGPVGCGKTCIVEHLANVTGRVSAPYLLKVQLGDEIDAKMLLGSYRCTDVPGEFIWQPGVLTQAVLGGYWLLLEDIDSAPSDVVAVLACLLETGTISVPGFKDNLTPTPGFQIFFTYRLISNISGNYQLHSVASELLQKDWLQVNVEPLTKNELIQIVQVKFPALKTIAAKMVTLYLMFSSGDHEELSEVVKRVTRSGRQISTRDLMKWCSRAEHGFNVSSSESALNVLQDAIDIFCCSVGDRETRMELARKVAACLGIIQTKADFFCTSHKPIVNLARNTCTAGRVVLPVLESEVFAYRRQVQTKFAFTRPASCLIERVAICLSRKEPVLLVGETGTGKTSTLQLLAQHTGHKLVVLNMNQQSDSTDLLGGFKPVEMKQVLSPIRDEFEALFRSYFSVEKNLKFLGHISTCFMKKRWDVLLHLMKSSQIAAVKRLLQETGVESQSKLAKWRAVGVKIDKLEIQLKQGQMALAFTFIEGTLIRALKEGHWVLLDEINLASPEALQCLSSLLEGGSGSLSLLERGDAASVPRHPEFRLMAAMNPATDVGKKDLPPGIRNRFTELFVDELVERSDLCLLVSCYLPDLQPTKVDAVVKFYLAARSEAEKSLCDATGHKPHYSLRTLCRALSVAAHNPCANILRSLHSALSLSFLTQLDTKSHHIVQAMINRAVVEKGDIQSVLKQPIPEPSPPGSHICVEGYWVANGKVNSVKSDKYILTSSVRRNLQDLVRSVSLSVYPILLQGDTCVGKTSLITFLAKETGNKCVRINNHEHTDLQEYIGSYCADPSTGNLVFREGVLVEAMRQGHWIILDELNLAPTDVLEALNRVLDDNRELYIPETQQTIKADPHFRLFATQNPPGLYGGRKVLSRAFRNRFIELHFNEIPGPDLEIILQQRCDMPASYSKKLVAVMSDLQTRRRGSAAFAGKQGFVTLRDLFRWGERYRLANQTTGSKFYDWDQHIADEGYLVLAGRVRKAEECKIIRQVIEKHIKRKVDPEKLFTLNSETSPVTKHILEKHVGSPLPPQFKHIFWTFNLRRLAVLIGKAYEFKEPVLLVGETGCGKTTVSQLIAYNNGQKLLTVNCHQHSESSDFLGGLRPVRDHSVHDDGVSAGRLFEWVDGPLIEAMTEGQVFLADEISLADDSVLERLNSLLEPERILLLSEKGTAEEQQIVAADNFRFVGTMNPGGDFGKKELSPALRNRLTEIWCECISDRTDWVSIIEHNVAQGFSLGNQEDATSGIGNAIMDFITWFKATDIGKRVTVSIRDILMWVQFINTCAIRDSLASGGLDIASAYIHGACLTLIDSLGAGSTGVDKQEVVNKMRQSCLEYLINQMQTLNMLQKEAVSYFYNKDSVMKVVTTNYHFGIPPFFIKKGDLCATEKSDFTLSTGTTYMNACRVLRGLQLSGRAILLEGSPGVGKTSLVTALAQAAGYPVTRINLSDQTDVSDLFGADLPVEGAAGGTFAWRDGPLLRALKNGHWILLDELNLASQSVLEGLNAVLDHRGELFIPELGKTFHVNTDQTKLFACQNPLRQGGARRGLPQSFLNRFTQVFIDPLTSADLLFIISTLFPNLPSDLIESMVHFNERLSMECGVNWANKGAPWEMNLRDLTRWAQAMKDSLQPGKFVGVVYADRMRTLQDKQKVLEVYSEELGENYPIEDRDYGLLVTTTGLLLGDVLLPRRNCTEVYKACQNGDKMSSDMLKNIVDRNSQLLVLRNQLPALRSLAICVENSWMAILVGKSGSGKTSVVRLLSQLCGQQLRVLAVNSAMDTTEILGGFEQADHGRHLDQISEQVGPLVYAYVQQCLLVSDITAATDLLSRWEEYIELTQTGLKSTEVYTLESALRLFEKRIDVLKLILNKLGSNIYTNKLQNDLNILLSHVQSQRGLNTGGTFEWVDSILVKCLQEGSWLLIDNVNLCSCAVLDRLNALLEPGGVLSLGERGVDSEGKVVTIKPHPGFRLFLAMDPRHGEISRAMRNRGVELCLLSPEEKPLHSLDLEALLYETGLTHKNHQTALKNIHNAMVEHGIVEFGFNSPTVSNLLHTATLIIQHWLRGQPLAQSFETCCKNVYVKARHFTLEQKQRAFEVLSEVLKSQHALLHEYKIETSRSYIQSDLATVCTLAVQESSSVAMLKQQGAIIAGILKALSSNPHETLTVNDLLDNEFTDLKGHSLPYTREVKLSNIVHHVLLSFYSKATKRDITTRNKWIEFLSKTSNIKESTVVCKISNSVSKLIMKAFSDGKFSTNITKCILLRDELPWDLRRALWNCSADWSLENKIILLMHMIIQNHMNNTRLEKTATDKKKIHWKNMTVSKFSSAFNKGEFSELTVNDIAVIEFSQLIARLNEYLSVVLTSKLSQTVNSEQFGQILATLHWKHRLETVGERHLFVEGTGINNLPKVSDHVLMVLKIHYKWLIKWLLPQLLYLIGNEKMLQENEVTVKLLNTVSRIESSVYNDVSPLLSVAKSVGNILGKPLPRLGVSQAEATQTLISLQKVVNVFEGITNITDLQQTVNFVVSDEGKQCRMKLVEAQIILQESGHCTDKVSLLLKDVKDECLKHHLIKSEYHKKNDQDKTAMKTFIPEVALWPIHQVFFLYLLNAFRNFLAEESGPSSEISGNDLVTLMLNWSQNVSSVPPNLVALLHVAKNDTFSFSLMTTLMQQYTVSAPFKNFRLWLHWNNDFSKYDTADADIIGYELLFDSKEKLSVNTPLISLFVTSLISQNSDGETSSAEVTSLSSYEDKKKLVTSVKDMLWRSGPAIATHCFGNGINEESCVRKLFNKLITSLKISLQEKGYLKEFHTDDSEIMDIINPVLTSLRQFVDTRRTKQYFRPVTKNMQKEDCVTVFSDNIIRLKDNLQRNQSILNQSHEQWMSVSEAWVLLGLVKLLIFSCTDVVDPVFKKELKLQYAVEEQEYLKNTLIAEELQSIIQNTEDFTFKSLFEDRISCLAKREEVLKKNVAVRPDSEVFTQLYRELAHVTSSICSSASVINLLNNLKSTTADCNQANVNRYLKEAEGWMHSVTRFITNLHTSYTSWFPDIVIPVINSLTEMSYGIHLMSDAVHKLSLTHVCLSDIPLLTPLILSVGMFPIPDIETALKIIEKMCLSSSLEIINKSFKVKCKEEMHTPNQSIKLAKCCLHELSNVIAVHHSLEDRKDVWATVCSVLKFVAESWQKQEELRKQKQQEEESYFINKVRKPIENLSEEEELELDMEKWFPNQKHADFGDLEGPSLDEKKKALAVEYPESEKLSALTNKEMNEICQIHTNIITQNTNAHWICRNKKQAAKADFITTFLDRFSLFGMLLESYCEICYNDVDHKVLPALCLATNNFINIGNYELQVGRKQYDFYHHSNVSEVTECIPILKTVTARIVELLAEWPNHPTLNQINVVIDRIRNFSITSPVSRFLTGLELLLTKMHEWEENAHSGVSLATYIATVTNQILKWRKLELVCWKGSLESSAKRMQEDTSKWWFHLYCLVTSYDEDCSKYMDTGVHNYGQLITTLEQFMESSVLGDFQARLNLLYTFHCQVLNNTSPNKDQISTIFWNLYQYYLQFSTAVRTRLYELALPIEKKLRGYVKIAKWNDINYWSVKGTIEKTHRTLLKYIKEYEAVLKQPVTGAMTKLHLPLNQTGELKIMPDLYIADVKLKEALKYSSGRQDTIQCKFKPSPRRRIRRKPAYKKGKEKVESRNEDVSSKLCNNLSRGTSLFLKARKLCKELILCSETPGLIYTVDCIANELYDSSQELKNLDVNRTLPKEKQKSEAKSILQRKRKNLSDMFKALQTMGLSYRAGIIVFSDDTEGFSSFATIPPLDIEAALGQIETRLADKDLLTAWKGCNEYYFHSVALLAQLRAAISKPHKDIGPPIIERCKGFTMHLMKLCQDQKKQATDSCQHLYMLRCQIKQLTVALDDNTEWPKEPPQMLSEAKVNIIASLNNGQYCLQQFLLVLDACPEQETHIPGYTVLQLTNKLLPDSLMSPAMCAYKYDSVWQEIKSSVNDCIKLIEKIKSNLTLPDKAINFIENLKKVNPNLASNYSNVSILAQYSVIVDSLDSLSDVKNCISKVMSSFELKLKHEEELHPFTECLFSLKNNIDKCLTESKSLFGIVNQEWTHVRTRSQTAKLTTQVICDYESTIDGFINTLLIAIQELYKRNVKIKEKTEINTKDEDNQKETESEIELVENHLKDKVVNKIFSEIKLLKMETVNQEIIDITKKLTAMVNWNNRNICKGVLRCCLPLLEQYYLLSQYLVTQQISALKTSAKLCSNLLSVFTDLALKGFRIPEDLLDEGEEGESQMLGGMGLGEGEGEKDVSDQIESQDQLEDAKPAGQEKEEENKDCKEEEKGIEMSDDFGGKLQDVEEKEKENNSDEESEKEEEEPDKEMGETEQGADTLDQQLWGSDTEEEEEDKSENKEEKGNTGEQVGEKEYGPKDESKEPQDDEEDDKNKSEDKKKEINKMEEPSEDDDQVDPYHGKHKPEVEPEPLDLPEELNLDNEEQKDEDREEENPFDIDAMKEPKLPDDQPEDEEMKESQEKENPNESESNDEDEGAVEKEGIPDTQSDEENADDGDKNDEGKVGEENKPEDGNADDNVVEETAKPSEGTPSMEPTVASDQDAGSKDQVSQSEDKSKELKPEDNAASEGPDTQGVGTAEKEDEENMEQGTQGSGTTKAAPVNENEVHEIRKRQRPGESDDQRALGNGNEPKKKKLKTINKENKSEQNRDETQEGMEQETNADIYQHIKEAKDVKYDAQTLDTATDEQAEKQPKLKEEEEEEKESDSLEADQVIPIKEDDTLMETEETLTLAADELVELNDKQKKTEEKSGQVAKDNFEGDTNMEVEGEIIQTSTVVRGSESTIHTQLDKLDGEFQKEVDVRELRTKLEEQLASWSQPPLSDEAEQAWNRLCTVTSNLSRDLSEQLRLVLEPTQASRLKGDFRTGRRINMRKVIPYIASQFRKDKIWLRRTKPSKREYQIVLAVDDSSSMADNHSKELAFESLAVVSKALTLLEAGDLCVLSFGEKTKVLHQLGEPFTEQSGARLLQQFSFEQQKTHVGELVNFASTLLSRHGPSRSGSEFAQLLIIVSDGRGVLNEGEAKVAAAVRRAKHQGVFMVFIIVDNPTSKDSILDIRMPKFSGGKLLEIASYMDSFPFPFYMILRDINNLPAVLSDALRQWFELVTSVIQ